MTVTRNWLLEITRRSARFFSRAGGTRSSTGTLKTSFSHISHCDWLWDQPQVYHGLTRRSTSHTPRTMIVYDVNLIYTMDYDWLDCCHTCFSHTPNWSKCGCWVRYNKLCARLFCNILQLWHHYGYRKPHCGIVTFRGIKYPENVTINYSEIATEGTCDRMSHLWNQTVV